MKAILYNVYILSFIHTKHFYSIANIFQTTTNTFHQNITKLTNNTKKRTKPLKCAIIALYIVGNIVLGNICNNHSDNDSFEALYLLDEFNS